MLEDHHDKEIIKILQAKLDRMIVVALFWIISVGIGSGMFFYARGYRNGAFHTLDVMTEKLEESTNRK